MYLVTSLLLDAALWPSSSSTRRRPYPFWFVSIYILYTFFTYIFDNIGIYFLNKKTESRAITAYIADKHKEKGTDLTRHADAKEAAIVKLWSEVESHHFNPAISAVIHQLIVVPLQGESPNAAIVEENLEKLGKVLDVYEERLGKTKYLAGDSYTLADLHHVPYTYYFMKTSHAGLVNDRPNVKAWWEDLCSRPAFLKVSPGLTVAPVTS